MQYNDIVFTFEYHKDEFTGSWHMLGFPSVTAVMDFEQKQRFTKMTSWERPLSECSDMITSEAIIQMAACGSSVGSLNKPSRYSPTVFWVFFHLLPFLYHSCNQRSSSAHTHHRWFLAFTLYCAVIINLPFTGVCWLTFGDHKKSEAWSAVEEQKQQSPWGQFYFLVRWKKKLKSWNAWWESSFQNVCPKLLSAYCCLKYDLLFCVFQTYLKMGRATLNIFLWLLLALTLSAEGMWNWFKFFSSIKYLKA